MRNSPVGTIYLLKRAELALRACVEVALEDFQLTPNQFLLLVLLRDGADLCAAELARELGVRPQSMTETVLGLERRKLVERKTSPVRRRALQTRLTPLGSRLLADTLRVAGRLEAELLANVSTAEIATLQRLLICLSERAAKRRKRPLLHREPVTPETSAHPPPSSRRPYPGP